MEATIEVPEAQTIGSKTPETSVLQAGEVTATVEYDHSELTEEEWLRAASIWQAEDFADEPGIYTLKDGKPFREN
ncbi:MAG: hypothetical protein M3347_06485 [Armatimonadota bacterium]|nr:hypothetical protein [Armatimonadota bacterium]